MSSDTHKELSAISNMLKASGEHGLQVECVWSALQSIASMARTASKEDIEQVCAEALCEWDI